MELTSLQSNKLRQLDARESFLWLMGREEPFSIQWTIRLAGKIKKQQVEAALVLVQWQHPLLNCTISTYRPFILQSITQPIRLAIHKREDTTTWEKHALSALSHPLPLTTQETFLTVDWITDQEQHEFIFTIDHAFSDLRCLTGIGCDFLTFLDVIIGGGKNIKIKRYPELPLIDTLLPSDKPPANAEKINVSWGNSAKPLLAESPYHYKLPYVHSFSIEETQRIIAAARQQHCSVHAMLCAIMAYTLNDFLLENGYRGETFCFTPVDSRPYLQAKIAPQQLGNFAVGIFPPFRLGELLPFWELAISINRQLQHGFQSDYLANSMQGLNALFQETMSAKDVVQAIKIRDACAAVSNVGIVALPAQLQHFQVLDARIGSASPIMSGRDNLFWLVVETLNGRLQLEFLRTNPGDDLAIIQQFVQHFVSKLKP